MRGATGADRAIGGRFNDGAQDDRYTRGVRRPLDSQSPKTLKVLGVHCSSGTAYFSLVEEGALVESGPLRLTLPDGEESARLKTFVDDLARTIKERKVDAVAILKAEGQAPGHGRQVNVAALERRTIMETLVQMAALAAEVGVGMVDRPRLRNDLGLGRSGSIEDMLAEAAPGMDGKYWKIGRGLAAAVARARMVP